VSAVLVTGATGFVGGHLCRALADGGARVRGLVRPGSAVAAEAAYEPAPAGGLDDREGLRRALEGVDTVYHLAARVSVLRDPASDPEAEFRRVNVDGTRVLAEEAAAAGVRRFVFLSSVSAVAGSDAGAGLTEEAAPGPTTPYGRSKHEAERLLAEIAREGGFEAVSLRPPMVYGPGAKANIFRLFELVHRGVPVPVPAVENRRSVIYVGNLVDALAAAGAAPAAAMGRAYFVADDEPVSTAALVRMIGEALGRRARLARIPAGPAFALGRAGDLAARVVPFPLTTAAVTRLFGSLSLDTGAFRAAAGWAPRVSTPAGLERMAAWFLAPR
jgi:nucleoside-diphosphate-sugar epimerase